MVLSGNEPSAVSVGMWIRSLVTYLHRCDTARDKIRDMTRHDVRGASDKLASSNCTQWSGRRQEWKIMR